MEDKTIEKIQETIVYDWQKPNISKIERAEIINDYMKRKAYSLGEMSKKLNIPKTTLFGWLLFGKMSEEEYNTLKKKGFSETDIFNKLKERDSGEKDIEPYEYHINKALIHIQKAQPLTPDSIPKTVRMTLIKIVDIGNEIKLKTIIKK